jgi:AmmeMemoRadiSam system protein B
MPRTAVVDGQFYPADPQQLRSDIAAYTPVAEEPASALGLLSPHAGYVFSGGVAGRTFGRVRVPDCVVLLNPSHHYGSPAFALWTAGSWQTPLGEVQPHPGVTEALESLPMVTVDDRPHLSEHSGEVVVPFLQYLNPEVRVAFVCVTAAARLGELWAFGSALAQVLADAGESAALVVASSDMSHESGSDALAVVQRNDAVAIEAMERLDPDGLHSACRRQGITMCGVLPAAAMMASVAARGGTKGTLVARATSADSPMGRGSYVVGYAGMVFD